MKMVADILGLKVRTVVFHKYGIMEKLWVIGVCTSRPM